MPSQSLSDTVYYDGPRAFSASELRECEDLFRDRAALFHTATDAIPADWVGEGTLDLWLPIPVPGLLGHHEIWGNRSPRLWVDHIQRVTGKIRWKPIEFAEVTFETFDRAVHGHDIRVKAVLDALKVKTTGRRDGRTIHYFGAIIDDNSIHMVRSAIHEHVVSDPTKIGCRITVKPA